MRPSTSRCADLTVCLDLTVCARGLIKVTFSALQLITEQRHERYDERRVNVLKAQNIQLERQLALVQVAMHQTSNLAQTVSHRTHMCRMRFIAAAIL
eukprot:SAG11_NODE_1623_length_4559_cov_2.141480_3_plen_97_part_00